MTRAPLVLGSYRTDPWEYWFFPLASLLAFALVVLTPVLLGSGGSDTRRKRARLYLLAALYLCVSGHVMAGHAWVDSASVLRDLGRYAGPRDIAYALREGLLFSFSAWFAWAAVLGAALLGLRFRPAGPWVAMALGFLVTVGVLVVGVADSSIQFPETPGVHISDTLRHMPSYEPLSPLLVVGSPLAAGFAALVAFARPRSGPPPIQDTPEELRGMRLAAGLFALGWGLAAAESHWMLHLDRVYCKQVDPGMLDPWTPLHLLPFSAIAAGSWILGRSFMAWRRAVPGTVNAAPHIPEIPPP